MSFTLLKTIECQNRLGEGVQWNPLDQCVWWTDIHAERLYRYHPETDQLTFWSAPERIGCFAFAERDPRLLVAFASGIAWWDIHTGAVEWLARPELDTPGNRFNDGRVDRQGRFWAGGLVESPAFEGQSASLYSLSPEGQLSRHLTGLRISNALCWSPDSRWLYHADSPSLRICRYPFDPLTGQLGEGEPWVQIPEGIEPDGACVDAEGCVWNAQWGGSQVVCYSPAGEVVHRLELPVSQPTCVALGGPDLHWLLVTSAREGLSQAQLAAQPLAGSLMIFEAPTQGLPESRFNG